ncbi:hypothetical protein [Massiliimalia massiliensis]|uniref:hypothetical protein n=1 Tax=Massiliimalia massiliensis TaxID=1852384 RepID=UPI001E59A4BE|nr:hypothetical protein [Massiliimalia massiliensis]
MNPQKPEKQFILTKGQFPPIEYCMKNKILHPVTLFVIGVLLGVGSKLLDIYDTTLYLGFTFSEIFSQFSIWVLFGVFISIFSETKKKAMLNIFLFCAGMLLAYYLTAELTNAVYGWTFIKGWAVFACLSPVFAYFTWLTKEKGFLPKIISSGIVLSTLVVDILLFGGPRWWDIFIVILLIYLLFIKKINRQIKN